MVIAVTDWCQLFHHCCQLLSNIALASHTQFIKIGHCDYLLYLVSDTQFPFYQPIQHLSQRFTTGLKILLENIKMKWKITEFKCEISSEIMAKYTQHFSFLKQVRKMPISLHNLAFKISDRDLSNLVRKIIYDFSGKFQALF